jgi:hypothetical protein
MARNSILQPVDLVRPGLHALRALGGAALLAFVYFESVLTGAYGTKTGGSIAAAFFLLMAWMVFVQAGWKLLRPGPMFLTWMLGTAVFWGLEIQLSPAWIHWGRY